MSWVTTKDGRQVNTDWFDKDRQIEENKKQADDRNDRFKRDRFFEQTIYDKLPKKMQVKNIVSIGKHKDSDGVRYNASVVWEDGFNRSVSEYGWKDFKGYLEIVLFENRKYEQ